MTLLRVVLLKSNVSNAGGLEKHASRIANAFLAYPAQVTLLTTGPSPPQGSSPLSIYSVTTSSWPPFRRMEEFDQFTRSWLQRNPSDLVFGMDRNRFQTHIRAGNGVHAAYLHSRILAEGRLKWLSCMCNPMHLKILSLEKQAFENRSLKKVFANSHMVKQQILERYPIDAKKIEVIHNGVEWMEMESDFLAWPEKKIEALHRLQLDPDHFHFLFIGNGYLRKGLVPLLHAFQRIPRTDVHLSVVGKEKRLAFYQQEAQRLGLSKRVHFFGPQSEIRSFYQWADALVIPSFYDPFANVTVEALAMGLFVISSKQNGGHEILHPEQGAIIDAPHHIDALSEALEKALHHKKTLATAKKGRHSVRHLDFSYQMKPLIDSCLSV